MATFMWVYPQIFEFEGPWDLRGINGGSWGGWKSSTAIPAPQRLDMGSIQHLMTLWSYSNTIMACHHGNIYVSIHWDFWVWGSLTCINCGSWGGWKSSTAIPAPQRLDIGSIQHLMTLWSWSNTIMACHHGNIYVSITPDFWVWGSLTGINGGSWGGWSPPLQSQLLKGLI